MTLSISDLKRSVTLLNWRRCLGTSATMLLSAALLTACEDLGSTESPYWATVAAVGGITSKVPVTRAQADALPYASILAWLDSSGPAFMVLGEIGEGRTLYYYSRTRQVLITRGAFLVQTVGLPGDLSHTSLPGDNPPDLRSLIGQDFARHIDIQAAGLFDLPVKSHFSAVGMEKVTILERDYTLLHIREDVAISGMKPFQNDYWVDADTGFCWKSRQYLHDRAGPVNIEIIKPAG